MRGELGGVGTKGRREGGEEEGGGGKGGVKGRGEEKRREKRGREREGGWLISSSLCCSLIPKILPCASNIVFLFLT